MIKFEISSQIVEVAPNNGAEISLTVTNTSQIIDFFTVTIEPLISPETMGLYPGWVEFNTPTFSLRPAGDAGRGGDSSQTLIAKVNIPPQVYAGNYAGRILVTARSGADNSAEIPFNIVISQIDAQTLEIQPIDSSSRKSTEVYRVVVSNQGNAPHIYSVYAEDPNDDLKFTLDPPEVPLRPGEQAALTLKAQPRTRNWVGDDINHEFKVKMEGSDQEIRGSFKQKAAIAPLHWFGRHWGRLVLLLALLLVLLIVGAIFLLPMLIRPTTSAYCAPVSLRNVNVLSNGATTNILVSGRNGVQPYAVAVTEQADKLPGIFGSLVSVSPDGRRIAYVTASDLAMNDARIWIKNLDTDQAPIASIPITTGLWPVAPVWSANGDKLAYAVRRPTPLSASGSPTATTAATTPAVGVTGTATTAPPATTAAATTASGTPGADAAANPSQLDLFVVTKIGEDPKLLASPSGLEPKLFYGNNTSTNPLCWASDDASLLVRPESTDNSQVQVALADGKTQVITPQAGGLQLPKPSLPSLPSGLVLPLNSLVGVPASFLQAPQAHLASVPQQVSPGTGTTTPAAKPGTTPATGTTPGASPTSAGNCAIAKPFSQNDPRWADLPLRTGGPSTMAELGCPITGAAILLNYQSVDTTPAELSSCLGNLTSPLNQAGWFAIAQQCGGFKLQGGVRADFSWDLLDAALLKGPTIVGLLGGPSGSHFLVVTGGYNAISSSYTVADPWDGSTYKNLDYFLSKGYRPRWVISYEGNGAACVTGAPDTTNQVGIRTTGAVDGGLYQTSQPFRYEVTGSNDTATATVRIVNPRLNLDSNGQTLQPNETQTFSTEGNYTIAIAVKDANGNTVLTRNIYFTIDHTAPVLGYRLAPAPDKTTNKSVVPVNVTLLATDDLSGIASIEYQVNGSQWQLYTSDTGKASLTISDNGAYAINYRATDGAGNTASAQTINFVIEKPVAATSGTGSRPGTNTTQGTPTAGANGPGGANGGAGAGGAKTSAPALSVPTVTPMPSATPRPAAKNTPTVAPTIAPTTLAVSPTVSGTNLLPTGSPAISATATVALPTSEVVTPTATIALQAVLAVPVTTLTFLPDGAAQQLQIQNNGNAPLIWTLSPGSSSTLIGFSSTTGNIAVGGSATVNISLLAANLTGSDENTTFTINSNGGSQTVGVIIQSQPLPSATLNLIPSGSTLNITNTIQVNVTVPNPNVKPNHIDLYATYKNCVGTCTAAPVKINSLPYSDNATLTSQWGTADIIPQDGISLGGNICMNADCSIFQAITPINNLSIVMTAAFAPPTTDNSLPPTTTLSITSQSDRTKRVNITVLVDNVQTQQFVADAANNWTVAWDTSLVSPLSTVVVQGEACNTDDGTGACLPIPSLTGYHTVMGATVASLPDIAAAPSLTGTISFVITPTANVKSVTVTGFYAKSPTSTQDNELAGTTFVKDSNNTTFTVPVDTSAWPTQTGSSLTVNVCFNQDGTGCVPARAYTGLFIPAGPPAQIIDLTAEPKYTTINTAYPTQLSAKIVDSKNNPVQGVTIDFQILAYYYNPNGPFARFSVPYNSNTGPAYYLARITTGPDGIATVPADNKLIANDKEGNFQVLVSLYNDYSIDPLGISLNNTAPGAKPMTIVGGTDKQTAKIGTTFPKRLQVKLDGAGAGVEVTFTSQESGLGATFNYRNTFTALTDASGVATAGDLIANVSSMLDPANYPIVGVHSVRASATGYTPVLFTLTNLVGDPYSVNPVVSSGAGKYDVPVASVSYTRTIDVYNTSDPNLGYPDIAVQVKDVGDNLLQSVPVVFTSPVDPQPGVTFNLSSGTSTTVQTGVYSAQNSASLGVAVATGLRPNLKAGVGRVTATVTGFPAATNNNFNLLNLAGSPVSLEISTPLTLTVPAGGGYTGDIQATVYDQGHNPVQDTPTTQVLFSAPDASNGTTPSIKFNNQDTTYTATVAGGQGIAKVNTSVIGTCKAGNFQVSASLVGITANPSNLGLSVVPGAPGQIGEPTGYNQHARVNTKFANNVTATVKDNCGNLVPNQPVTFSVTGSATDPSGTFDALNSGTTAVTVNTDQNGVATAHDFYANNKALSGFSYDIVATDTAFNNTNITLFNDPGLPASFVTGGTGSDPATPLPLTAGRTYTTSQFLSIRVYDSEGNAIFVPDPVNDPTPAAYKIVYVGNGAPLTGVGANFDSARNFSFPDANGLVYAPQPLTISQKVGGPYAVSAHAAANSGVNINLYVVSVPDAPSVFTLSDTNSSTRPFQQKVNLICNGNCLNSGRIFNGFKIKLTDQFRNVITNTSVTFVANQGTGSNGRLPTANFGTLPLTDDTNNRTYTVNTNNNGEIALSDTNTPGSIIYPGFYAGDYTIDAHTNPTNGDPQARTSIYMENLPDDIPQAVSIQITTGQGSLGTLANPLTTTVTTAFPQMTAYVRDGNGNGINGKLVTFSLNPAPNETTTPSGIWVANPTNQTFQITTTGGGGATINNGVTQPGTPVVPGTTDFRANKRAGVFTLTASAAGPNNTTLNSSIYLQNTAENAILSAAQIIFNQPGSASAQADQFFAGFTAHLNDQYGNPISGYPVTFSVPVSATGVTTGFFVNSGDGSSKLVQTNTSGNAVVGNNEIRAGINAGGFQVTANVPTTPTSGTNFTPAPTVNLTNLPSNPDPDHITTSVGSIYQPLTVGTAYTGVPITVTIADKYGNLLPSASVSYTISPAPNPSPAVASADYTNPMSPAPNTNFTVTGGTTTITAVKANTVAGDFTITVHANGVVSNNPIHFTNRADYPNVVTILSGNNQAPDVGQVFTNSLQVKVTDQYGNLVGSTNPGGGTNYVLFTAPASGPSAIFSPNNSNVVSATVTTSGVAVVDGNSITANNQVGGYNITTAVPGQTLSSADSFAVTNLANIKAVAVGSPNNAKLAGGEGFGTLQARVIGANNTGVANYPVTFSVTNGQYGVFASAACQGYTNNGAVTSKTVNTDANGTASITNFCAGTYVGSYNVIATIVVNGVTKTDTIGLSNTADFGTNINGDNQSALANGGTFNNLSINVVGYNGIGIPGVQVTFGVASNYAVIAPPATSTTNNGGIAQASLTAGSSVGSYKVVATFSMTGASPTHFFNLTNTVKMAFTSTSPTLLAGGQTGSITAQVQDFRNNGVPNVNVRFTSSDTNKGAFSGPSADLSDASGNSTVTLQAGNQLGTYTVTAEPLVGTTSIGTSATLQATTSAQLLSVSAPTPLAGGESVPVSVTVAGFNNTIIQGAAVNFAVFPSNAGTGTITTTPVNSNSSGVASTQLTSGNAAGTYNIIASLNLFPSVTVTIPVVNRVNVTAPAATELLAGGATANLTFQVRGYNNTAIQGATIAFTSSNTARGTVSSSSVSSDNTGAALVTITSQNQAGPYTIAANGLNNPPAQAVNAALTNTVNLSYDAVPTPLAGGGSDNLVVTAIGAGSTPINGVTLAFTGDNTGAGGNVTGGPFTTGGLGTATVTVSSNTAPSNNSAVYGAWSLGVAASVSGTDVLNGANYNVPVTNTLLISTTTATTTSPPRPVANGGTDTFTVQVSGANNYKPNGVTVSFAVTGVSGNSDCSNVACGSVNSFANTGGGGIATATVTARTGTTVSPTTAQAYDVQAALNINGATAQLATPVRAINTVKIAATPTGASLDPSQPLTATVTDNAGAALSGFTVQFTVNTSAGAVGATTADGYLCLTTCGVQPTEYLGMRMLTVSGKAGINFAQQVQSVSTNGSNNDTDYGAVNVGSGGQGVTLRATGGAGHAFKVRARVIMPGLPTGELGPSVDFSFLTVP